MPAYRPTAFELAAFAVVAMSHGRSAKPPTPEEVAHERACLEGEGRERIADLGGRLEPTAHRLRVRYRPHTNGVEAYCAALASTSAVGRTKPEALHAFILANPWLFRGWRK